MVSGERVKKSHSITSACGDLDELMSIIGVAYASLNELEVRYELDSTQLYKDRLATLQKIVFDCGTDITTSVFNHKRYTKKQKEIPQTGTHIEVNERYLIYVENLIDELSEDLGDLHSFIMPMGETTVTQLQLARAVCRRAERGIVDLEEVNPEVAKIVNRLSDLFFVLARHVNCVLLKADEALYDPRESALN